MLNSQLEIRARQYASSVGIHPQNLKLLGHGQDGCVWNSGQKTAIKVFQRDTNYYLELECYQRLEEHEVNTIGEFSVPKLMHFSNDLLVIEMELVAPPYILDFGKVHLDFPPDYSPEIWEDWHNERRSLFGEDRWPQVLGLLAALESYGIYYQDPKPGNIAFRSG